MKVNETAATGFPSRMFTVRFHLLSNKGGKSILLMLTKIIIIKEMTISCEKPKLLFFYNASKLEQ